MPGSPWIDDPAGSLALEVVEEPLEDVLDDDLLVGDSALNGESLKRSVFSISGSVGEQPVVAQLLEDLPKRSR